ncbi:MAG: hypothetical protein E7579_02685 [Ruminococcaceae bacterium]|nr:hypothetical protein [Oscillospiraceae bacterium]
MKSVFSPEKDGFLTGRRIEWFHHTSLPEWGYAEEQTDTFAVLHPSGDCAAETYPLYVVFHSAGHDVYSTVACTWQPGNHDIYHAPKDMFALYLDCRQHMNDWWWGGNSAHDIIGEGREGTEKQPVENRAMATIEWVMKNYPIDWNRVYAVGNSMGGSGALGIAMCRGDVFAAVKANVPAGVVHMEARCCLNGGAPEGFRLPDPPVLVDYSAQNDGWSKGHERLYRGMRDRKYAVLGYWGMFGHENNNAKIYEVNDLVHSFDLFSVRLNEAYPVFTNADCDDVLPWSDDGTVIHENAGQVNSFFRWDKAEETPNSVSIGLRLLKADEWESRVTFPTCAKADVTMRRLQKCRFAPGTMVNWTYGDCSGTVRADDSGLVTVPALEITAEPTVLTLRRMEVSDISAEYNRTADKTGYADGTLTIRVSGGLPDEYRAYWADETGARADYTAFAPIICTGETTVYSLVPRTLIPCGADRILVYPVMNGEVSGISACAMLPEGVSDYDFGKADYELQVQSDIHITLDQNHIHNRHFINVLEEIKRLSPDSIGLFINGDTGDNADPRQYENAQEIIRNAGEGAPKVYFAIGNHDLGFDNTPYEIRLANFLRGTNNEGDKSYFDRWINGLHFIFLGGEKVGGHAWLSETQLTWLDEKLAENRDPGRPVYVFLHQGMIDTVAGTFAYQHWHGVTQTKELAAVLKKYPEVIMFAGHSHWVLNSLHSMKFRDSNLPTIFNTSSGGYLWDDESEITGRGIEGSEGYYFYGYKDKVIARGRDFAAGKWIASAQFIVDYSDLS